MTTTLVGVLKPEKEDLEADPDQGIVDTYKTLWDVIRLPAVISYAIILLTSKVRSQRILRFNNLHFFLYTTMIYGFCYLIFI